MAEQVKLYLPKKTAGNEASPWLEDHPAVTESKRSHGQVYTMTVAEANDLRDFFTARLEAINARSLTPDDQTPYARTRVQRAIEEIDFGLAGQGLANTEPAGRKPRSKAKASEDAEEDEDDELEDEDDEDEDEE